MPTHLAVLVRREWNAFRRRGRIIAMVAVTLAIALPGVLLPLLGPSSTCSEGPVEVPCPAEPTGPRGEAVSDNFFFVHRPLGRHGSITVRVTSMTGIITYPPPRHDEIVSGLVPWAKAGVIIKDGTARGSSYAALMLTGEHGVRMQHDYTHDVAGRPGGVSAKAPRWLRLTRSGDTITGYESADGERWEKVGTARPAGLPATVRAGLFVASPGDLTLRRTGLGAGLPESRFTQATAVFDRVRLNGAPRAGWTAEPVGRMGQTDWERYHRPPGLVRSEGSYTVSGTGDIGPIPEGGRGPVALSTLNGLVIGLIILIVVAARFAGTMPGGRVLSAKALVTGPAAFLAGLVGAGIAVPVGSAVLAAKMGLPPTSTLTEVRVVAGAAALACVTAVFALGLGALVRRGRTAIFVAVMTVVLPYAVAVLPLLPDEMARWVLRLTPAAGFAVLHTVEEYPQVIAHYAPSAGYFPLPGPAGLAVLCAYAAVAFCLAVRRMKRSRRGAWGPGSRPRGGR